MQYESHKKVNKENPNPDYLSHSSKFNDTIFLSVDVKVGSLIDIRPRTNNPRNLSISQPWKKHNALSNKQTKALKNYVIYE